MKPKRVWKISPYEPFEVDAIAGWMDEMSHQGLQFCTKVGPFCRFESRPGPARYRVDPRRSEDGRTEEERMATYRDFGWEFCSNYTQYAEVYCSKDSGTPELHTDRDLLGGLVKQNIRNQLGKLLVLLIPTVQFVRLTAEVFTDLATQYHPGYLSLLLICVLALLIILMTVVMTVSASIRYKKRPETIVHTAQRAKHGAFWRGLRFSLVVLCAVGWVWALIYAAA